MWRGLTQGMAMWSPAWQPENKAGMSIHQFTSNCKRHCWLKINPRGTINKHKGLCNYLLFSSLEHIPCGSREHYVNFAVILRIPIGLSKVPTNYHRPWLSVWVSECVCEINHAGVKKPRHFQVHNGLMYPHPSLPQSPSQVLISHFSPPVKTAYVISWIADNARRANATLFVQPLWTKFGKKKCSVLCSRYQSETYYTSLKTDLLSSKSIWGHSFHCSSSLNRKHRSFVIFFEVV